MDINDAANKIKQINQETLSALFNVNYNSNLKLLDSTVGSTEPEFIIKAANISEVIIPADEILEIYQTYLEYKLKTGMTPYQALLLSKTFKSKRYILKEYIYQDPKIARDYELYIIKEGIP